MECMTNDEPSGGKNVAGILHPAEPHQQKIQSGETFIRMDGSDERAVLSEHTEVEALKEMELILDLYKEHRV